MNIYGKLILLDISYYWNLQHQKYVDKNINVCGGIYMS